MNNDNREVLLKVEHLEQFFKLGKRTLKAVNDVNFEVYKGEVFGLVGESGCGKTTTGRSIIKLYDITGGSVYFGGTRIAAGVRRYKDAIKSAQKLHKSNLATYKAELKAIKKLFGENAKTAISSTKAITGHGLSLAGVMEAAFCAMAIKENFTPGSAHITELEEEAQSLNILTETKMVAPKIAISMSSGFGGANTAIVLEKVD